MSDDRRRDDSRINRLHDEVAHLHECVELVKQELARNTIVTEQVRDILSSFRIVGAIAKWIAAVLAALAAIYHGAEWLRNR